MRMKCYVTLYKKQRVKSNLFKDHQRWQLSSMSVHFLFIELTINLKK